MTNFLAVCEELVAALDPKVVLTDGYGPITSLALRSRAIFTHSNNSMTKDLPEYGTVAYCASKFVNYPPMINQFPDATKKVLSPAAQAVLDAAQRYEINPECYSRQIAAAALRAAADQVVPKKPTLSYPEDYELGVWVACDDARVDLLAIADELEAS